MEPVVRYQPQAALTHPLWVGCLVLLVVNDHVLKGWGPGMVTGKLSDLAGLVVLPALIAAVASARTRRQLATCHLVAGATLAALQVPAVAELWDGLVGGHTTPDPTDLIALPALALSWFVLVPAMARGCRRPLAERSLLVMAVVGTVATQQDERGVFDTAVSWSSIEGELYIHNGTSARAQVQVRPLHDDVLLDCATVAKNPGRYLPSELFGPGEVWDVPSGANVPVRLTVRNLECGAALVEHREVTQVVFTTQVPEHRSFPGGHARSDNADTAAALFIEAQGVSGLPDMLHDWAPLRDGDGECPVPDDAQRLEWVGIPTGAVRLERAAYGPDGCWALTTTADDETHHGYLCMPEDMFPFAPGDDLDIDGDKAHLELSRSDGAVLGLSNGPLSMLDLHLTPRTEWGCTPHYVAACPQVGATGWVDLFVGGEAAGMLHPVDAPTALVGAAEVRLVHHVFRVAFATTCAQAFVAGTHVGWVVRIEGEP